MGVIELGMTWWCDDAELSAMTEVHGVEHVRDALARGHGCLLLSAHFSSSEITGRTLARLVPPMCAMYRPSNNPFTDQIMRRARGQTVNELIAKDSIRELLKALRRNAIVWYAADQAYSRRGTALATFFGEPAMTNTATSQIAKVSGAPVVPYFPLRIDGGRSYRFDILPALQDFPTDDADADAQRINKLLEERIRIAPEQYYWVHRRFKGRPDHLPDPY
jgi:KDO2-lipid IV(A) lauroyltransferase